MKNRAYSPILVFGFNRPKHIASCLEALSRNTISHLSELFIFIDAPRNPEDITSNEEVLEYCETFHWPGPVKKIIRRESNFGLAKSIVTGVTEIIESHGRIIVLEDDIVTSSTFLSYMNSALDTYENEEQVMHVNGYNPVHSEKPDSGETFFSRMMFCWGWATWASAWKNFNANTEQLYSLLKQRRDRSEFNFNGAIDFEAQLRHNLAGTMNTWAVKWTTSIFLNDGLCLTPQTSYVSNIGMDGSGVHYNADQPIIKEPLRPKGVFNKIERIPIEESSIWRKKLRRFYSIGNNPSFIRSFIYSASNLIPNMVLT
jgi:hypothetical protein